MFNDYTLFILYKFNQVKIHEPAVKRAFGLDASELALLFLCAEQIVETVVLIVGFGKNGSRSLISRLKSTEPRRSSLASIIRSKRSEASPISTGTAAICSAIMLCPFLVINVYGYKVTKNFRNSFNFAPPFIYFRRIDAMPILGIASVRDGFSAAH